MKLKQVTKNGTKMFLADLGLWKGRRERYYREKKSDAQAIIDGRMAEMRREGEMAFDMPYGKRLEYLAAEQRLAETGDTIEQAVSYYLANRKKIQKKTLHDAWKECIASKIESGKRKTYTNKLNSNIASFVSGRGEMLCSQATREMVQSWAWSSEGETRVKPITARSRIIDIGTFFSFCMKRLWCSHNPVKDIEPIALEDAPPGIHTVGQVRTVLDCAKEHDPELLGYLCPLYFGGLRPAEAQKLQPSELHSGVIEVQGQKSKTRKRRFIQINETLEAWLKYPGVKFGMSKRSRKLETLRWILGGRKTKKVEGRTVRIVIGFPWPHDCLRHSFCSYSLPKYGAAVTAANAGHSEQILFAHYRERVKPDDVTAYWALRP